MYPPKSTTDNSNKWRTWHGINYFIGGSTFLVGSLMLFPIFNDYLDAAQVSGWLYTIGSATFLLADITQWLHYVYPDCRYLSFVINFFTNVIGSLLYLLGSICFIPQIAQYDWGMNLFIGGSFFIAAAQVWKLLRTFCQNGKSFCESYKQDKSGVFVDLYAGLGALMYFLGTFVFQKVAQHPELINPSATIYSFGGLFFFTSAAYIQKRYFWERSQLTNKLQAETQGNSVVSTQM